MVFIKKRKIVTKLTRYVGTKKQTVKVSEDWCKNKKPKSEKEGFSTDRTSQHVAGPPTCPTVEISDSVPGQSAEPPGETRYAALKQQRLREWKDARTGLQNAYLKSEVAASACVCGFESEGKGLYRCVDCADNTSLCRDCLLQRHQHPHLHLFEAWRNEAFVGCIMESPAWELACHPCGTSYFRSLVIVDDKGRQHVRKIQFCKCETEAARLIRFKLWPSTTKSPRLAFTIEFMRWMYGLQLESHVSVKSFCEALVARCPKHHRGYLNSQVKDIYKVLMTETFEEFRFFLYNTENLSHVHDSLAGTQCPACFTTSPKIYSFDADFQLVRKASSGKNWDQPKHADHFFLDQGSVDSFIKDYSQDKKKADVDCSDFQAGNSLRSKNKNAKLEETAVFGSTCRHEFPKYFFSLKHGERLGYSVFLLKKLLEEKTDEQPIHVLYDIACILESHLKKQSDQSWTDKTIFSIPIFHCYGHKMKCQVLYSPRKTPGIGLTDGESLERLWSYLGKFSKITKEMTPENRTDLLVDGLLHYGRKIIDKIGTSLTVKLDRAAVLERTSTSSLQDLLKPIPGVSDETVLGWIEEEKTAFTSDNTSESFVFTPQEDYCQALEEFNNYRLTLSEEQQRNEKMDGKFQRMKKKLEKLKKSAPALTDVDHHLALAKEKLRRSALVKIQGHVSERIFLIELLKKYAKGQAVAIRLSKQLKKVTLKAKAAVQDYNSIQGPGSRLPMYIHFDDVKSQTCEIWSFMEFANTDCAIPSDVKTQAVQLRCLIERAREEQVLLVEEMKSCLHWYKMQHGILYEILHGLSNEDRSCAIREGFFVENRIHSLGASFRTHVGEVTVPTNFSDILELSLVSDTQNDAVLDLEFDFSACVQEFVSIDDEESMSDDTDSEDV